MTTKLVERIFQAISEREPESLSFADYMRICLYDPEEGYYADPRYRKIGRSGDFYTSVSVGDCFGFLLGLAAERRWREDFGSPQSFRIVEQGAHDGQLARDFLAGLKERDSPLAAVARYTIFEPDKLRAKNLVELLRDSAPEIEVVSQPPPETAPGSQGLFLGNELLDAFPVCRLRRESGTWRELRVAGDPLHWQSAPIDPKSDLGEAASRIPNPEDLPDGYTTEICLEIEPWMSEASRWFERGRWWVIDYGREAADYFSPERRNGTLRGYRNHQRCDDPFLAPGETDLTADVNFTEVDRVALRHGLSRIQLADQHHFLIETAKPWLASIEASGPDALAANRKRLRQFQTLTHPDLMGRAFKVAEYWRG
ncbi:MAG: SAM-dependent methyltransferase [Verrucomicrobiae bacterium]|nr:SAM-dependent methyltransferase [Verrucomicrobiae bacterium]